MRCRQIEKLKRALLPKHSDKPCFAVGFLLIFQHCVDKQRKILRRQTRQLEGYFSPFKGKADDLVGRIASIVQSNHHAFIAPNHGSVCVLLFPAQVPWKRNPRRESGTGWSRYPISLRSARYRPHRQRCPWYPAAETADLPCDLR